MKVFAMYARLHETRSYFSTIKCTSLKTDKHAYALERNMHLLAMQIVIFFSCILSRAHVLCSLCIQKYVLYLATRTQADPPVKMSPNKNMIKLTHNVETKIAEVLKCRCTKTFRRKKCNRTQISETTVMPVGSLKATTLRI